MLRDARVATVAILGMLVCCASFAQPKELIFNSYLPPMDPAHRIGVMDFAKRIEAESGGTLKVTIPPSTLAPPSRQWELVTQRVADVALSATFLQRSRLVMPMIADLPLNSQSGEAASIALWNVQQKHFAKFDEFKGVKLLSMFTLPPRQLVTAEKPVRTLDDLQGMKIWTAAGSLTDMVKGAGAVAVHSEFSQLYEYASKRTVDGYMLSAGTITTAKIGEFAKHVAELPGGFGSVSFSIVMNEDTWKSLDDKQKAAVLRAAEGLPQRIGRGLDERERAALAGLKLQVAPATPNLRQKLHPLVQREENEWIARARRKGLADADQVLTAYRAEMKQAQQQAASQR